jgi:hypothetical protein
MSFPDEVKLYIADYVEGHIPTQNDSLSKFSYI